MAVHEHAGQLPAQTLLTNIPRLVATYYSRTPDSADPAQQVAFGTSGHRGSALSGSFNERHILAISQAICEWRHSHGYQGPLFLGMDTHALSEPAWISAVEVFAANGVPVRFQRGRGYTPTPVISHAIVVWNRHHPGALADGVVITPSHNPPQDGGFKYNPPHGGPAGTETTRWIEQRANALLQSPEAIRRMPLERALRQSFIEEHDYIQPYIQDLRHVVDLDAIRTSGLKIGVDPMGGSGIAFWEPLAEMYGLNLEVVNATIDPRFAFMPLDKDGVIRMDCSSPYAMRALLDLKDRFEIAFGNDPDYDRHGIVTASAGLLNPNHYLAAAVWYLFQHRPEWTSRVAVGKTMVTTSLLDRIANDLQRPLVEVPVGFKWFVEGLQSGELGFGGEESAGATFLRREGSVWTTDKDGFVMDLLAAEITAVTGSDPARLYDGLTDRFGAPIYERLQAPADAAAKAKLKQLSPDQIQTTTLAGETIRSIQTTAPANDAPFGGVKVVTDNGWFAARPSGTEDIYKIYTESFLGREHLQQLQEEAQQVVDRALYG
ncbi:phosphoglucomutase (alpha-D-glucose-1,6-bisphosphate-dependent) [Desulfohalobium retbaense]|uniref:Phosphoglucomutase, alpha-D-glucose phosphate-specific n=1 Tax=Desulfohalobium retbaense (strain ATCC 49708 / DSM 5692 / JCM 16813 / HR100) TaxID=485915 RepID=C8X2H1_DESRD|nr:phosphoglucomutase (alpha-D-glucose-1,6-bisphosphate-dependent) [Desulfohalobium retbaense]ACV68618.1 phosphoglucomutase, alpha-D-glucose phosphate- specific [Desulfohalobium retbaense DSM 5692]